MIRKHTHKALVLHLWRLMSTLLLLSAAIVWLYVPDQEEIVFIILGVERFALQQWKGWILNKLEDIFGWPHDFDSEL